MTPTPTTERPLSWPRVWQVLRKDLALGPRSPVVLWALVIPILMTLLVRLVFGSLFDQPPRLGIVDQGDSAVTAALLDTAGIDTRLVDDPATLRRMVEDNDLDAGLTLPAGFDAALRAGQRPALPLLIGGESLASNRIIVAVTTLDVLRQVAGQAAPVTVDVVSVGEAGLDFSLRALPMLVMLAVAIAGAMVPAASLVDERVNRTLDALLVTPVGVLDVLVAKGILGVILATLTGIVTLLLNGGFGASPLPLVIALVLGGTMMAEIGLMLGCWARDTNTLFAAWKSGAILIVFPVIFYLWPELPQWIARIGPTYWFLEPVFALSVEGARASAVWGELAVAFAIVLVLAPAVVVVGHWMERRLAAAAPAPAAT
jgi:ABC-2 type transport system permease protein